MAASSNPFIFTGPRGHFDESAKNNKGLPGVSFAKVLKTRRVLRRGSPAHIPAFLQGAVATSSEGQTRPQKCSKLFVLKKLF